MRILSLTSVKDEGPFLLEWLAWHRILGVSDFIVVSNDCRDGTDELLDLLAAKGLLTHLRNPCTAGKSIQWQALQMGWAHPLRTAADWMLVSDLDEFPMIHPGAHRFADLIEALPTGAEAVALGWRLFGNGGRLRLGPEPVTQSFTRAAPEAMVYPVAATQFKTLFRPSAFTGVGVHRPAQGADAAPNWVDGSGRALPEAIAANPKRLSLMGVQSQRALAEMHHYSLRSLQSFLVKSERGLPNRSTKSVDLAYWVERNFNAVECTAAQALAAPLAAEMASLLALPGVQALQDAAVAWHHASFARLLQDPQYFQLFTLCRQAGSSAVIAEAEAMSLYRLYQQVKRPEA